MLTKKGSNALSLLTFFRIHFDRPRNEVIEPEYLAIRSPSQAFLELFFPRARDALSSLTLNSKPKVVLRYLQ